MTLSTAQTTPAAPVRRCAHCGSATGPFVTGTFIPHPETGEDPETTAWCKPCAPFSGPEDEDFSGDLIQR